MFQLLIWTRGASLSPNLGPTKMARQNEPVAAVRGKGGGGPTKRVPHDGKAPVALFPKQDCLSDLGCPRPSPCSRNAKAEIKSRPYEFV